MSIEQKFISDLMQVPYLHGGRDPQIGLDCYGMIMLWYKILLKTKLYDLDIYYDKDWSHKGRNLILENYHRQWTKVEKAHVYDIVLFKNNRGHVNHGGIILSGGRFLHACRAGIVVQDLKRKPWNERKIGYYRFSQWT